MYWLWSFLPPSLSLTQGKQEKIILLFIIRIIRERERESFVKANFSITFPYLDPSLLPLFLSFPLLFFSFFLFFSFLSFPFLPFLSPSHVEEKALTSRNCLQHQNKSNTNKVLANSNSLRFSSSVSLPLTHSIVESTNSKGPYCSQIFRNFRKPKFSQTSIMEQKKSALPCRGQQKFLKTSVTSLPTSSSPLHNSSTIQ